MMGHCLARLEFPTPQRSNTLTAAVTTGSNSFSSPEPPQQLQNLQQHFLCFVKEAAAAKQPQTSFGFSLNSNTGGLETVANSDSRLYT